MNNGVTDIAKTGEDAARSQATMAEINFERRKRIRKWLIFGALVAFTVFVYVTGMVKMAEVHHIAHFM